MVIMIIMIDFFFFLELGNFFCKIYEIVVFVDLFNYGYYLFFVKFYCCVGLVSIIFLKVQYCVVVSYDELNIEVFLYVFNFYLIIIKMKNYISCVYECVISLDECDFVVEDWDDQYCVCRCRYFDGLLKELVCKDGFRQVLELFS